MLSSMESTVTVLWTSLVRNVQGNFFVEVSFAFLILVYYVEGSE